MYIVFEWPEKKLTRGSRSESDVGELNALLEQCWRNAEILSTDQCVTHRKPEVDTSEFEYSIRARKKHYPLVWYILTELTYTCIQSPALVIFFFIYSFVFFYLFKIRFRILMFEEKKKGKARPTGVAPKRDLSSLP